jgi:hypothetical protein
MEGDSRGLFKGKYKTCESGNSNSHWTTTYLIRHPSLNRIRKET